MKFLLLTTLATLFTMLALTPGCVSVQPLDPSSTLECHTDSECEGIDPIAHAGASYA